MTTHDNDGRNSDRNNDRNAKNSPLTLIPHTLVLLDHALRQELVEALDAGATWDADDFAANLHALQTSLPEGTKHLLDEHLRAMSEETEGQVLAAGQGGLLLGLTIGSAQGVAAFEEQERARALAELIAIAVLCSGLPTDRALLLAQEALDGLVRGVGYLEEAAAPIETLDDDGDVDPDEDYPETLATDDLDAEPHEEE